VRLNKFLAKAGICSRRKAETLIEQGLVSVNGEVATITTPTADGDVVICEGQRVSLQESKKTILFYKPRGVISTTSERERPNLLDCVPFTQRLFPIGRLDKDSEGLLLLTSDGDLALKLTHPRFEHEKEYEVTVYSEVDKKFLQALSKGVELEDGVTLPARVRPVGKRGFRMVLKEGRNRQIRRMCEAHGYRVKRLIRIRTGSLRLDVNEGEYRTLTQQEVEVLLSDTTSNPST
jgi:pseudouridine synthase